MTHFRLMISITQFQGNFRKQNILSDKNRTHRRILTTLGSCGRLNYIRRFFLSINLRIAVWVELSSIHDVDSPVNLMIKQINIFSNSFAKKMLFNCPTVSQHQNERTKNNSQGITHFKIHQWRLILCFLCLDVTITQVCMISRRMYICCFFIQWTRISWFWIVLNKFRSKWKRKFICCWN